MNYKDIKPWTGYLGTGAFAVVKKAKLNGMDMAVKIFKQTKDQDRDVEKFLKEVY